MSGPLTTAVELSAHCKGPRKADTVKALQISRRGRFEGPLIVTV